VTEAHRCEKLVQFFMLHAQPRLEPTTSRLLITSAMLCRQHHDATCILSLVKSTFLIRLNHYTSGTVTSILSDFPQNFCLIQVHFPWLLQAFPVGSHHLCVHINLVSRLPCRSQSSGTHFLYIYIEPPLVAESSDELKSQFFANIIPLRIYTDKCINFELYLTHNG